MMRVDGDLTDFLQASAAAAKKVVLPRGVFSVSRTVLLHDGAHLCGSGDQDTTLVMAGGMNSNMFTNAVHGVGNKDICLENIRLVGNQAAQWRPEGECRVSFCNAVYLANVKGSSFKDIHIYDVFQTALHFSGCSDVSINNLHAEKLGWSGISTSGTDDIVATNIAIINSGNDHRHSAVHLDGGSRAYVQGVIRGCVGNGVMLDSAFAKLTNCVVEVEASSCMRGVALIGDAEEQASVVCVRNSVLMDNDVGIMVSNARGVFLVNNHIEGSRECGVLFQGRAGGCDSFVIDCRLERNEVDIRQIHQSRNNVFVRNTRGDS